MLLKCVCTNCGYSYLADDQTSPDLECPRCRSSNEGLRTPPAEAPSAEAPAYSEEALYGEFATSSEVGTARFAPEAPPPMFLTTERFGRGIVFGSLGGILLGGVLGAAFAAINLRIPALFGVLLGFVVGAICRYGFGGRTVQRTRGRAIVALGMSVLLSFGAVMAGGWAVERLTGVRAEITRKDLDVGLEQLLRRRARVQDEGERLLLQQQAAEVERLLRSSSGGIEDYLWMQEAQLANPLLAYAKLRATRGPAVRLGPEADPIHLATPFNIAILAGEMLIALILAARGVLPLKGY